MARLVNKQFNTPIGLYSEQNIREVISRDSQILANGAVGVNFNNPMAGKPSNLQNSAVLRMLEEEEHKQRTGQSPSNGYSARPLQEQIKWPPTDFEHRNLLRSSFKDVLSPGLKRVAWPPPSEGENNSTEQAPVQAQGGPQFSSQSPNLQNSHTVSQQVAPDHFQRYPLKPLEISNGTADYQQPAVSPLANHNPVGFRPATPSRNWAPVLSPGAAPVNQPLFKPQQHSPVPPQYQSPALQQYQSPAPQQYQSPAPQQYQTPAPQQYQSPAPQQYQSPAPQQYQTPAPQQYQTPAPQQYQTPAPQQYQSPAPQQYQSPAPAFQQHQSPVPQQFQPSPQYSPVPQQYQSPPQQYQAHPQQLVAAPIQALPHQSQPTPVRQVEPPPTTITLRQQAPVSQAPPPVVTSQPATATLRGGKNLRGDLKWPPEEVKKQSEEENRLRLELAKGPACRPRLIRKDYGPFFAQHALNASYPGYKAPPGTQYY